MNYILSEATVAPLSLPGAVGLTDYKLPVLTCVAIALSAIAFVEPSPADLLIFSLALLGLLSGILAFNRSLVTPIAILSVLALTNVLSWAFVNDVFTAIRFELITFYMMVSWVFFVTFFNRFGERGLRLVMRGYTVGATVTALLSS